MLKRVLLVIVALTAAVVAFTIYANITVVSMAEGHIFTEIQNVPHNRVGLLLGTNPRNRYGRTNTYFTNRIRTAADLYHAGKIDYIIASGDNHTKEYDEPTAMQDSLMALGVPQNRIVLDFAGFRTLDSVVRAKEVFGCDSLTIISRPTTTPAHFISPAPTASKQLPSLLPFAQAVPCESALRCASGSPATR